MKNKLKCNVYLLKCLGTNFYKIGIAKNVDSRIDNLQPSCPLEIFEVTSKVMISRTQALLFEEDLHLKYADKRVHHEWFKLSNEEADKIGNALRV